MIVIVGHVVQNGIEHLWIHLALNLFQEVLISLKVFLFLVSQAVEAQVLQSSRPLVRGKSIRHGGRSGNLSPLGCDVSLRSIDGKSTLVELLSIMKDVLANLT